MRITNKRLEEIYRKLDPSGWKDQTDYDHKLALKETRQAYEAPTLKEAIKILEDLSWGEPVSCATDIRGAVPCKTCKGTGIVDRKA